MVRTAVFSEIALVVIALHKRPASTDGSDPAIFVCRMEGATLRPGYLGWFSAVRHMLPVITATEPGGRRMGKGIGVQGYTLPHSHYYIDKV